MNSNITKRIWSVILVFAMVLSFLPNGLIFASAEEATNGSKTDGQIVAGNYADLTDAEKKLIESGYLIGATHNYNVPDANDDLISVNTDNKTVTAKDYEGTTGYKWVAESADIVVGDVVKQTISFTDGKATYDPQIAGDAFAVKVKYEMSRDVDADVQKELLNAPSYLQQALAVMETLKQVREKLSALELDEAADAIRALNTAQGFSVANGAIYLRFKEAEKPAATALIAQMNSNSGNRLNISVIVDEYKATGSQSEYVVTNAARIKAEIASAYEYLNTISAPSGILQAAASVADNVALNAVIEAMKNAVALLDSVNAEDSLLLADHDVVRDDLTPVDYQALDTLVAALGDATLAGPSVTVKNPLVADTTTIQFNMAMFDVTAKVVLKTVKEVVGSADLITYATKTVVITLAEGATAEEIEKAVEKTGVVNNALTAWAGKYVEDKFTVSTTALPDTLTKDIEYVITYEPVLCNLDFEAGHAPAQVPYGYKVLLPAHSDASQAYDYKVNNIYYSQGSVYTVESDTVITRSVGKAYTGYTVNGLVSGIYFAGNNKAQAILSSGALNIGNDSINVRVPDNSTGIVALEGNELTANNYASSYNGLEWEPYSYKVVVGSDSYEHKFNGANVVTIDEANFDRVEVIYRLALTNLASDYVLQVANLPSVLVAEANEQLRILNALAGNTGAMEQVNAAMLSGVYGVVEYDSTMDPDVKARILTAINGIRNDCLTSEGKALKIYDMLVAYNDPNNGGLRYYYLNNTAVRAEIGALAGHLNNLLGEGDDTELKEALIKLLNDSGFPQYASRINELDELKVKVNEAAAVPAPNANINLNDAAALGKLTEALETTGTVESFAKTETLYISSSPIVVNADTKVTISATVTKPGSAAISINAQTYDRGHVLTAGDIEALVAELKAAIAALGVNSKYYTTDYAESAIRALEGQNVSDLAETFFAYTWEPIEFKVTVEGGNTQFITVDNLEITLPAGTAATRYEYSIGGNAVNPGTYKFTLAQIDTLFVNGEYHVTREEIDVGEEDLIKFVNNLNNAIGNNGIVFALTKDTEGKFAIVMKINAADVNEVGAAVKGMAMELVKAYTYVAFDDNAMIYDNGNGTEVSMQAVINTIMESSFGTEALNKLIDANGNILNIAMPGTVLTDKAMTTAGGELAQTNLILGASADNVSYDVPMYITLGSAPAYLTQLRNLLANQLAPYFNFSCDNGKVNVGLNLPRKAYEAYLAVLLASDKADITDIHSINEDVALGFLMDVIHPLMASDASLSSVQNTLQKFGYNVDLTGYDQAFEYLRKLYNSTEFNYNNADSTHDADAVISIKGFVDSMNMGTLGSMIAEYDTGLKFSLAVNLENLDKKYEALFLDIGAAGITNKFGLVENLAAKLPEIAGTSVVILMSDVNSDLTFNTTSVLNLNGYTVRGNITGNGSLRIVDTIIDDGVHGHVTGTISGNVKIAGGMYYGTDVTDVTAFLTEGYSQNMANGLVTNNFFNLVKHENGDISVELNAGMLATNKMPEIQTLAVDIIAELLLNGFTANSLTVEDIPVYSIEVNDLIGIYTGAESVNALIAELMNGVNTNDLKTLINRILADITDFEGMLATMNGDIANGTDSALLSYVIKTGVWGINVEYKEADDSITTSIVSNGEKERNLNIVVVGSEDDKQHFANLLGILADTTDADATIDIMTGGKVEGGFKFDLGASGNVIVNMASDPKYAVMLNVILADGIGAPANEELVAGLKEYFENGTMDALAAAFNKIKVSQVIDAIENVYRGENLSTMLANLGLSQYDAEAAIELESEVGAFVKLVGALLRRVNINGTATTLGAFINPATGAYTFDKENIGRDVTVTLGGYNFTFAGTLVDGYVAIKIFGNPGAPTVDYTELENQIAAAEAVTGKYTNATYVPFKAAWDAAKEARLSDDQAVVDAAALALKDAVAALVPMNYTELETQITAAENVSGKYTNATYTVFKAAWDAAKDARYSYDQAVVDAAALDLKNAIAALVLMDYTELQTQITAAGLKQEDLYTTESWTAMQNALTAANNALSSYDQDLVDQAAIDLKNAIDALQFKDVAPVIDYTELNNQIANAGTYAGEEEKYSEATWNAMQAALTMANAALRADSQEVVDQAAADLKAAIAALHLMDYSELEALIKEAEALDEFKYTAESWAELLAVLAEANATVGVRDQAVVDQAAADLKAAIAALDGMDYDYLLEQIELAESLKPGYFTEESWARVSSALAAAKAALNSLDQAEVNAAAKNLRDAMKALKRKPGQPIVYYVGLTEQIEIAKFLNEEDYTRRSWAKLMEALAEAREAYDFEVQELVDEAAENLKNAIAALVKKPAPGELNFGDLENAIAEAESKVLADYTADSWTNLQAALEAAIAARNADEQIDIDAAADALLAAIEALVEMNYADLDEQIAAAEGKDETLYTAESWANLQAALEAARAAKNVQDQAEVDAAAEALKTAIEALVEMNYSDLENLIAEAESKNQADYTADSWANLQTALEAARAAKEVKDQAAVNAAAEALKAAIEALVEMNYTDLKSLIAEAEAKKEDSYTAASWANLQAALEAAKEVLNSKDQAEVNGAAEALKAAIEALAEMDYSKLYEQIKATKGLYEDDYTADTWAALMAALAEARDAQNSKDQAVVDAAADALEAALAALEAKPVEPVIDYTELQNQIAAAEAKTEADYTADSWAAMQAKLAEAQAALTARDQATVDAAAAALKAAIEALEQKPVINYTELNNQIAAAESKTETEYTAESWAAMQAKLAEAKAALTSNDQAVVDAAAAALKAAVEALQLKPVIDYSELNKLIESTKTMYEDDYTAASWATLMAALKTANEALNAKDQAVVNAAVATLKAAIEGMAKMDYTKLEEQIAAAESKTEADYTAESWAAMQAKLAEAKAVTEAKDQAVVNAAADALEAAIAALELKPVIDYTELNNQIAAAEGKTEADYTAESWTAMQDALAAAKAALESNDQAVVDAAAAALKAAIEALETKPVIDNTELQSQIAAAEGLKEADYTAESWAAFKAALEAAKAALESNDQAAIDAAAAALKTAMDALEKKPAESTVDTSKLAEQIAAAEALKEENYTSVSWATLKSSLEAAKAAMTSKDQAAIDSATAALKAAIEGLEEKQEDNAPVIWPWILVAVVVVLAVGAGVAYFLISKKKKEADNTPLVDYDISDDNE